MRNTQYVPKTGIRKPFTNELNIQEGHSFLISLQVPYHTTVYIDVCEYSFTPMD